MSHEYTFIPLAYLHSSTPILLAAGVTIVHDPSPPVAVHGMHILNHLAIEGLTAGEWSRGETRCMIDTNVCTF